MTAQPNLAKAAAWYADKGWPVFPLIPRDKKPLTEHGLKDASTDRIVIGKWWEAQPHANIGLAMGPVAGLFAIDVDGDDGVASLAALELENGELPSTVEAITTKGRHLIFKFPVDIEVRNSASKIGKGIDVRGAGGYLAVAPSIHPSGRQYKWKDGHQPNQIEAAVAPAWLIDLVRKREAEPRLSTGHVSDRRMDAYASAALADELATMASTPDGQRNDQLNCSAFSLGTLTGAGMIDRATVERALMGAATAAGLPLDEATKTIKSGIDAGSAKPREVSEGEPRRHGASVSSGSAGPGPSQDSDWPEPGDLPSAMPAVEPFRPALMPDSLRALVMDIADRLQCPADFPAVALMVGLGTVAGRRVGIRPKRHDDWTVIPNLWGGVVGRPGVMKTPAIREPLRPLERLEVSAKEKHEAEIADWKAEQIVAKEAAKVTGEEIRKALRDKRTAHSIARQSLEDDSPEPTRRRFVANDPTVEKLGELLAANPNGILLFRDELTGFLHSLEREGREGSRAFYLEAWNGDGRFTYDRIGRGTIDIEAACVSILGGIQPGPLTGYMLQLAKGLGGDDGLMQRFQLLVWPDVTSEWVNVDREPDISARRRIGEIFDRLDSLDPGTIGAIVSDDAVPYLRFDEQAQAAFDEWRADLEKRIRSGNEHPAMEAHLSKYRSLVPSLALVCHLADGVHGDVTLTSFTRAAAWAEYLESHARRVYAAAVSAHIVAARSLAQHIQAGDLPNPFALRDAYRRQWSGLTGPDETSAAATMLVDIDWLRPETTPTQGRHKVVYLINPGIRRPSQ